MAPRFNLSPLIVGLLAAQGCDHTTDSPRSAAVVWTPAKPGAELYPVAIVRPDSARGLESQHTELDGSAARVACVTCHAAGTSPAFTSNVAAGSFHPHIAVAHGSLACSSCHVPQSPGELHTAAGERVSFSDAMTLCSQCHGPQRRNYDHGAHGGMRGYWDRQRGSQTRNDCVSCHSPHAPAYPMVTPVPAPKDRFANPRKHPGSLVEQRYGTGVHHE